MSRGASSFAMRRIGLAGLSVLLWAASGCSLDSAKSRYLLAEKLWTDGNYSAAVGEFEKVVVKDPQGKLGQQALFRAAMTQSLYLNQHAEAIRKLRSYIDASRDPNGAWEAEKQIGEILYAKTDQFEPAIQHYRAMIKQRPAAVEVPEFLFRIARSYFSLFQFEDAIAVYEDLIKKTPKSPWAERAAYEIGMTFYTRGGQSAPAGSSPMSSTEAYQEAMDAFQAFLKKYPESKLVPEAKFGIALCLEELDQLDAAYHAYEALRSTYPSPKVIEIKLVRIKERKAQRSR